MTSEEREAREWTLVTKMSSCPPIHSDLAVVAAGSEARIRGGESVRVVEAELVERELEELRAALAAREERNPDGKIQMYNLGGEYPELPTRLLEWPDFCTEVDRANAAEERVAELEAAAREDTERPDEHSPQWTLVWTPATGWEVAEVERAGALTARGERVGVLVTAKHPEWLEKAVLDTERPDDEKAEFERIAVGLIEATDLLGETINGYKVDEAAEWLKARGFLADDEPDPETLAGLLYAVEEDAVRDTEQEHGA